MTTSPHPKHPRFIIERAASYGMCFGVRDAINLAEKTILNNPSTILGELVHNAHVQQHITSMGAREASLTSPSAPTHSVIITAHGASNRDKQRWTNAGYQVTDTTCPLVHRAHRALSDLVADGHFPVVIGKPDHVEVLGLTGDHPNAVVVQTIKDLDKLPNAKSYGVISQTTQPIEAVEEIVAALRAHKPNSNILFRDTVCRPTKERQQSLGNLASSCDLVIVVGGAHSNNSWQLVTKARSLGCKAERIEHPNEVNPQWLIGCNKVGVTAGTSSLPEVVDALIKHLTTLGGKEILNSPEPTPASLAS